MDTLGRLFNEGTEGFQQRVSESVETITGRFGGLLEQLSERQSEAVESAQRQMEETNHLVRERVENTVHLMTRNMEKLVGQLAEQRKLADADANRRIKNLGEAFNQGIQKLEATLVQVEDLNKSGKETVQQIGQLVDVLASPRRNGGAAEPVTKR